MTTQFILSKDEISKLSAFEAHGKDVISNSASICLIDAIAGTLTLYFLGGNNDFSAKFILNILNCETDVPTGNLNYFLANIAEFSNTALKVLKGSDQINVKIYGDTTTSSIFTNEATNTTISIVNHDAYTESKVKKIIQAFEDYQACFEGDTYTVTPTNEFIDIMSIICKSMNASGRESNSAMVNHNHIKYCDPQGILEYTLGSDISPYDRDLYIQDSLVKYMSNLIKDNVVLVLDKTNTYAKLQTTNGLLLITSLERNVFQYPTPEEVDIVQPDPNECVTLKIKKSDLLESFSTFDGVFKADLWKWGNITFDASKNYLTNNKVFLSHDDDNAAASTFLPVQVISNTETNDTCKFLIGMSYLKDILSRTVDDEITFICSSGEIGTPHGTGFTVIDSILKDICIKIIKPED